MLDRLEEIFALQKQLNRRIGVETDDIVQDDKQVTEWVLNYARAMTQECSELVDSVPWKWWAKYQKLDRQNARLEVVDMLHFLVSMAQVLGMTADDIYELYVKKHELNNQRQDSGYTVKDDQDNRALA